MKTKVLIWNTFPLLERAGGPSTYLYNLKHYFNEHMNDVEVLFLTNETLQSKPSSLNKNKSILPQILRDFVRVNQNLLRNLNSLKQAIKLDENIDLNDFDIIHFHTTIELYQALPLLANYNGTVILTSHTPMAPHLENIGDSLPQYLIHPKVKSGYLNIDKSAFKRADVLLFPAKEALEPYFNTWSDFKSVIENQPIKYVATGVKPSKPKKTKDEVFRELNIPKDAIVICYAGRHNHVKGYDLLKEFGKHLLSEKNNVYFVILGKENPMKGLIHKNWIEVGWTTDPASYINASSLFVLPNRQTYFDLILLEVLSLGKRCLISETGGNKFFKDIEGKGVSFFKNGDLNSMIKVFKNIDFDNDVSAFLYDTYLDNFSSNSFGKNMESMYREVAKEQY